MRKQRIFKLGIISARLGSSDQEQNRHRRISAARTLLKTHGLTLHYDGSQTLHGIDFETKAGQVTCIMGTNFAIGWPIISSSSGGAVFHYPAAPRPMIAPHCAPKGPSGHPQSKRGKAIAVIRVLIGIKWCPETELNRRHADFQSAALPTELSGHITRRHCRSGVAVLCEPTGAVQRVRPKNPSLVAYCGRWGVPPASGRSSFSAASAGIA